MPENSAVDHANNIGNYASHRAILTPLGSNSAVNGASTEVKLAEDNGGGTSPNAHRHNA